MTFRVLLSRSTVSILSAAACSCALVLTGCGIGDSAPATESFSSAATIHGIVHGGNQLVTGATVTLFEAGYTGYGSTGASLASATTGSQGNFSFTKNAGTAAAPTGSLSSTWQCDSAYPDAEIFILVTGGNTQGTGTATNSAAAFLAALGDCSSVSSSQQVDLNEINTVATVYALAQYMTPGTGTTTLNPATESIGTSGTAQGSLGLVNARKSIANLGNISSGSTANIAPPTYTGTGATVAGVTVTATVDSPKLIIIANILASCVNQATSTSVNNCSDLFANATSATNYQIATPAAFYGTASDTVQAAYFLATNPGLTGAAPSTCANAGAAASKAVCLYGLVAASGAPYQSTAGSGSQPSEYSLQVNYSATGTCSNTYPFILGPYHAQVDASGDIWFINGGGSNTNLSEISPTGTPLMCLGNLSNGRGMTIDVNGNIWASFNGVASNGTTTVTGIQELVYNSTTGYASSFTPWPVGNSTTTQQTYEMTSDGFGNVFYSVNAAGGTIWEFVNAANASSAFPPVQIAGPFDGTTSITQGYLQVDTKGRLWNATSTISAMYGVYPVATSLEAITGVTTTGGAMGTATFTVSGTTAFTAAEQVQISGLTSTTGKVFDGGTYAITAVGTGSFTVASSVAAATATDSGTASIPGTSSGASSYAFTANTPPATAYGMAIDSSGNLYQGTTCCGTAAAGYPDRTPLKWFTSSSASSGTATLGTPAGTGNFAGMNGVRSIVVDGASNAFYGSEFPNGPGVSSTTNIQQATGNWSISELTTSGTSTTNTFIALSPSGSLPVPADCTTTVGCATLGGFFDSLGTTTGTTSTTKVSGTPYDMQVDLSGNLWVLNSGDYNTATDGYTISEVIGVAAPVVQPLSVAVKNSQLGTRP
jgi:hypothetical protein